MVEQLSGFIIHLIQTTGHLGVFILMTLESALIPIPSEVTMPFAGFLASKGELSFITIVFIGALGNVIGSVIGYYIGFFLEENVLLHLIKKYGKFILITESDYQKSFMWFKKYGSSVVFFSRMLPAVRTFISLPAGVFKMNIVKFVIYTFVGSLIWSAILAGVGFYFGSNWKVLEPIFRKFDVVILAVFVLAVAFYLNHKLKILKFPH